MRALIRLIGLPILLFPTHLFAQIPEIEWQNTIGASLDEFMTCMDQTADGGYIIGGYTLSDSSGDKSENAIGNGYWYEYDFEEFVHTDYEDFWVVKLDSLGNIEWENTIGGDDEDILYSIQQTEDGGYILGGESGSGISGDKTDPVKNAPYNWPDYWLVKLFPNGEIEWQKTIGAYGSDRLIAVRQTSDNGFILAGNSSSDASGDKSEEDIYGGQDLWIVKVDSLGNIEWENTIGGGDTDYTDWVEQTSDGGYIISGTSYSSYGFDKTEGCAGHSDFWIIKLNAAGNIMWQNSIGGNLYDDAHSITQLEDGNYILSGNSSSGISGEKTEANIGSKDFWIMKLSATGNIIWQNTIGGTAYDYTQSIIPTVDGGFLIGGWSDSGISGDKTMANLGLYSSADFWMVKLDGDGNILWQKAIGASSDDYLVEVQQTADNEYFLAGYSRSPLSGDKTEDTIGGYDFWVVKLGTDCYIELCNEFDDNCNGLIDDDVVETITISADGPTTFCPTDSVTLTAVFSGETLQWKKNGFIIPGATNATYTAKKKGFYTCTSYSNCDTVLSSSLFVNVLKGPPSSIIAGGPTSFCEGGSVELSANPGIGLSYQWYRNGDLIAGATSIDYTAFIEGSYKCQVIKTFIGCYKMSNTIEVTVPCREGEWAVVSGELEFSIYPNPNHGNFQITVNTLASANSPLGGQRGLFIYNSLGQLIYSQLINSPNGNINETISLDHISSGIYFVQ